MKKTSFTYHLKKNQLIEVPGSKNIVGTISNMYMSHLMYYCPILWFWEHIYNSSHRRIFRNTYRRIFLITWCNIHFKFQYFNEHIMWYFEYCKEEPHVSKNTNGIFLWGTHIYKEISYIHVDRYSKYRDEENPHTKQPWKHQYFALFCTDSFVNNFSPKYVEFLLYMPKYAPNRKNWTTES